MRFNIKVLNYSPEDGTDTHERSHTNHAPHVDNCRILCSVHTENASAVMLSNARHCIMSSTGVLRQNRTVGQGGRCLVTRSPLARGRAGENKTVEVNWDGKGWTWEGYDSGEGSGFFKR